MGDSVRVILTQNSFQRDPCNYRNLKCNNKGPSNETIFRNALLVYRFCTNKKSNRGTSFASGGQIRCVAHHIHLLEPHIVG